MLCPKCGSHLPEHSSTCSSCGASVNASPVAVSADGAAAAPAHAPAPAPAPAGSRWTPFLWLLLPAIPLVVWWAKRASLAYPPGASPQAFWVQFALVLGAILIGMRAGGVALGLIGGLGVQILTLGFRAIPSEPPIQVMLIIMSVVTAAAALQVAGGLDYMVQLAERLLRAHPQHVTILAPLICFLQTFCLGTGHGVYALLPVIADVALRTKIRPERPLAASCIASQMGNTSSPVSGVVAMIMAFSLKTAHPVSLVDVLKVTFPANLVGVLACALWCYKRGKELYQDPDFLKRLEEPAFRKELDIEITTLGKKLPSSARRSVLFFFGGVLTTVLLALDHDAFHVGLLPVVGKASVPLPYVVQMTMLAFGAFILFTSKIKATDIARSQVFNAGMVAAICIFGIAWMSDTFVSGNKAYLVMQMKAMVQAFPWTFGVAMFCVAAFVKSQTATMSVMFPFGVALQVPTTTILGLMTTTYGHFFFCFYPSDLAAISMDRTGTTRGIGRFFLDHSFMTPGLVGVGVSTAVAYMLSRLFF